MHIKEIKTSEEFLSLERDWKSLLGRSRDLHIFQTYEWNLVWWENFSRYYHLNIIVLKENDNTVGILPLVYSKQGFGIVNWRRYEFMAPCVSNYHDVILAEDADIRQVLMVLKDYILSNFSILDYLELRYIPAESPLSIIFNDSRNLPDINRVSFEHEPAQKVDIDEPWDRYFSSRSRNLRHDIKHKLKRINEAGNLEYADCKDEKRLNEMLLCMTNMQIDNWDRRGRESWLEQKEYQAFDRQIGAICLKNGWLFSHYLTLDKNVIACHFGFKFNKHVYYHEIAYSMSHFNFSPGKLLQYFELKEAFDLGLKAFDFAQGSSFYKDRWCNKERKTYRIYFFKGKPCIRQYYLELLKPVIRKSYIYFKERIKPSFKRLIRAKQS